MRGLLSKVNDDISLLKIEPEYMKMSATLALQASLLLCSAIFD